MGVVVLQIIERGAPVPGLDIIRTQLDHGVEQFQRDIALLRVHRGLGAQHQQRGGIARGLQPDRPDPRLDVLSAGFIRRGLERSKQEIQSARTIGAELRQLAGSLRQFLLLGRHDLGIGLGVDPEIVLGQCRDGRGQYRGDEDRSSEVLQPKESGRHVTKSRRRNSRCKAAHRQRAVKRGRFSMSAETGTSSWISAGSGGR